MANADHTLDASKTSVPWRTFQSVAVAVMALSVLVRRWRIAAVLGWAVAAALAAALLLGCSADPHDTEPEPQPELCPDVAPAEVPLPAGCVDETCRDVGDLARCVRTYACESRPGVCVTGWDCACAVELAACLGEGGVPDVCE